MSETANYIVGSEPIQLNPGRRTVSVTVANTGDRAIQVGSHFHFIEVNRALRFDRVGVVRHATEHTRGYGGAF